MGSSLSFLQFLFRDYIDCTPTTIARLDRRIPSGTDSVRNIVFRMGSHLYVFPLNGRCSESFNKRITSASLWRLL